MSFNDILKEKKSLMNTAYSISLAEMDDGDYEIFERSDKYLWYNEYYDDKYSVVDSKKKITINADQIVLSQEENSQVIPFMMDRYYDGIDLMDRIISVYFVNENNEDGESVAVNVEYSKTKIRFYWLVDGTATIVPGTLKIEIRAIGKNEKNNRYVWKTLTNNEITILKSLSGNNIIIPDESYDSYIELFDNRIDQAQTTADEALAFAAENAKDIDALEESASDCECEEISSDEVKKLF